MLTRFDPFQEMLTLRRAMERMFDGNINPDSNWQQPNAWGLALDVVENQDAFVIKASIPGINPDDIEITYNNDTLTIKGELKAEDTVEEANYHLRERRYGTFARRLILPCKINADAIDAAYAAGVLTLTLPKAEEVKPKRIAIKGSTVMIEGKTSKTK
jgi:HSP20 family protein